MAISKEYKNAIAKLNRANGKKPNSKGYLTPKQALSYSRKYKDVQSVEKIVKIIKLDKKLNPYVKKYNKYMRYAKGDQGYITKSEARSIGLNNMKFYASDAEKLYGEEVRLQEARKKNEANKKRLHTRLSKQSVKDAEELKPQAKMLKSYINSIRILKEKQKLADRTEFDNCANQIKQLQANIDKETLDFLTKRKNLLNKYRKIVGLPQLSDNLHIEAMTYKDIEVAVDKIINGYNFKDKYGNTASIYSVYKEKCESLIKEILSKSQDTKVKINNKNYNLSQIINKNNINVNLFWKAYHAWNKDGGTLIPKGGRKDSNYITLSAFFDTTEGYDFLQSIILPDFRKLPIMWDVG